jgi:hypothetical protein
MDDPTIREPAEYETEAERIANIPDPIIRRNAAVELLQRAQRDRALTDLPDYDPVIRKLQQLERSGGPK